MYFWYAASFLVMFVIMPSFTSTIRIQTGSYVGTGTYGEDNPCSITFDFAPVLVFGPNYRYNRQVYFGSNIASGSGSLGLVNMELCSTTYTLNLGFGSSVTTSYAKKSSDGKTLYWYNTVTATVQSNEANTTYSWVAIG